MKEEWIAGRHPVLEALRANHPLQRIWVAEESKGGALNEVFRLAEKQQVRIERVPRQKLDQVTGGVVNQGVVAFGAPYTYVDLDTLLAQARQREEPPFFIILDGLEDPHNLGSILRTADGVGAHGLIIPKRRAAGLTATVAKTSAGAIYHVPVARVTNLARAIERLKAENIWIYGTGPEAEQDYRELDYRWPLALVIGHEGQGISRLVWEKCDEHLKLPLAGQVGSLNASVAAGVAMFEVYRQRHPLG